MSTKIQFHHQPVPPYSDPDEILIHIFMFLPPTIVHLNCTKVSSYWYQIATHPDLWCYFIERDLQIDLIDHIKEEVNFF